MLVFIWKRKNLFITIKFFWAYYNYYYLFEIIYDKYKKLINLIISLLLFILESPYFRISNLNILFQILIIPYFLIMIYNIIIMQLTDQVTYKFKDLQKKIHKYKQINKNNNFFKR